MICPYDFLNEFENWFYWWQCIHQHKLTPEQATTNVKARMGGWELIRGMKYGGWVFNKDKYQEILKNTSPISVRDLARDFPKIEE